MSAPAEHAGRPTMRIALLGDVHDYSLFAWPWELMGKTLAGQINLWLNRRRRFDRSLIIPTIERIAGQKPDLLLLSGDLTTTSRPREFHTIARALQPLLDAFPAVITPGNHDRYTFTSKRTRRMESSFPRCVPEVFPHVRALVGSWRLLALDAATPRLLDSRGRLGARQLQHLDAALRSLAPSEGVVVLCHYPFGKPAQLPPMRPGHQLLDARTFGEVLAACRARTITIHGHVHSPWLWRPVDLPRVMDVNTGAPTMRCGAWPRGQGFWMMQLPANPSHAIEIEHHILAPGEGPIGMDGATHEHVGEWLVRRATLAA